jgi:hypothetical protein
MAVVLAAGGLLANASVARAGDFECRGTLGAVTIVGNLLVPDDSSCVLTGTFVQGNVVVKSRANLEASAVEITGGLQGESPARVVVRDSQLGNSISLRKAEDVNNQFAGGQIRITGTQVTGDVQLEENRVPITLDNNDIVGSIQANKNIGGLEITGNRIGNGLQCQDNSPPPVGGGNVAKQKQGQCQFL